MQCRTDLHVLLDVPTLMCTMGGGVTTPSWVSHGSYFYIKKMFFWNISLSSNVTIKGNPYILMTT